MLQYVSSDMWSVHSDDHILQAAPNKRYLEPSSLAVRSGTELAQDASADDLAELGGDLDVDLAELSLGQRLTALDPPASRPADDEHSDSDDPERPPAQTSRTDRPNSITLTRTLIQALHSTDTKLLETCLMYSDPTLITQTVQRLPPQLAVPLLGACVQRLGRTSSPGTQRAAVLVRWIRAVLVVHSGHLMTVRTTIALPCFIWSALILLNVTMTGPSRPTDARPCGSTRRVARDVDGASYIARVTSLAVRQARYGITASRSACNCSARTIGSQR
jgi:hypothetical protein